MKFFEKMQEICWEMSKKGHSKISSKIWPLRFWSSGSASDVNMIIFLNIAFYRFEYMYESAFLTA